MRRKCAADVLTYARFVRTRDEADPDTSVKPFPIDQPDVRQFVVDIDREQKTGAAKSRQVMATWSVCMYMTHWARSKSNQHVIFQTQKWDDAVEKVCMAGGSSQGGFTGRCQFIERNLPSWLKTKVVESEGRLMYPNGSMIEALAGGKDQIRGKTPSLIVLDEMAFLDEAKATYTSIAPLIQKGCKFIAISTPNGAEGNFYWHLWHGVPMV